MILANLTKAIREQNYYAVVLEFFIVVSGVLIAFQISTFAERHSNNERLAISLDRLHDEIVSEVEALSAVHEIYVLLNESRAEALDRLVRNDFEGMDETKLAFTIAASTYYPTHPDHSGVYQEITSAGLLSELGDQSYREALAWHRTSTDFLRGQIEFFRNAMNSNPTMLDFDYVQRVYNPDRTNSPTDIDISVDWIRASQDPEFLQRLLAADQRLRALSERWRQSLVAARALCSHSSRLTGRACPEGPAP